VFRKDGAKSNLRANGLYIEDDGWLPVAHKNPLSCNPLWPRARQCDQKSLPLRAYGITVFGINYFRVKYVEIERRDADLAQFGDLQAVGNLA
jgi:hypothetical protein